MSDAAYERGDVVLATDPFKSDPRGRPFLVVNHPSTPFHGEQYITCALTTRTWYDERVPLSDEDWREGGAPASSSVAPWSVNAIRSEWIDRYQGRLRSSVVDDVVAHLVRYIE